MDQTQREFLVEIEELVELIFTDLDSLRSGLTDGRIRREQREMVDRIFRRVHSVKGSAASSGLDVVSQIAHEFENLLDAIRGGRAVLNDQMLDTCDSAVEALSKSLSQSASETVEPLPSELLDRLRAATRGIANVSTSDAEETLASIPSEIWQSLTPAEKQRLVIVVEESTPLFLVAVSFDFSNFDEEFFRLKEKLAESGEVISTSPSMDDTNPGRINFRVLYASKMEIEILRASVVEFTDLVFSEVQNCGRGPFKDHEHASPLASVSSQANFVRTDLDKLDQLISSTHELLRATSNALGFALSQPEINADARTELEGLDHQIRKSFKGVEDGLINLRMVSLGPTLQRAVRAGRAAARLSGKEVDFEVAGEDIQLDKMLVDGIADPLVHLVRNAVDHGIEPAQTRVQSGKKRRGTVRIEVLSEGSQSRVRVIDDGRGIDPSLISKAATRLGIVETESGLDFERSLRLIFRPGFTTLESASDLSGRGVGLDVVETAVENVGGELRVSSKPAAGTTFEILLPVTFGILEATVFVSAGNRYCILVNQILADGAIDAGDQMKEQTSVEEKSVESRHSSAKELPVVSMRTLLGQSPPESPEAPASQGQSQVITCRFSDEQSNADSGTRSIGVVVDAVLGTEEVLVRTLGRHAGRWYAVAGATELRDGSVALVLDLPRLLAGAKI